MPNNYLPNFSAGNSHQQAAVTDESDDNSTHTTETSSTDSSRGGFFKRKFFRANGTMVALFSIGGTACGTWTSDALKRYRASEANNPTPPPNAGVYTFTGNDYLLAETIVASAMTFGFVLLDIFFINLIALSIYKRR